MSPLDALPHSGVLPDELLHPLAVEKLGAFFEDPSVCSRLAVSLSRQLQGLLQTLNPSTINLKAFFEDSIVCSRLAVHLRSFL